MQGSNDPPILIRRDEREHGLVAHLTINNPHRLNAMNSALMSALVDAAHKLAGDERLRAVVLGGAGPKAFIGGADIDEMVGIKTATDAKAFITRLHQCCEAIRDIPVPVIARIQGYCFGGGLEMAAACDVRISTETAVFGMPEVKLGIPSVIEAALLPTLVGFGRAREMTMLGENFTARDALAWGLVEHVVPAMDLDQRIDTWIGKLLTSKPRAVRLQKKLIRQWESLPLAAAVRAGIETFAEAYESDEPRAAMADFLAAQKARKRGAQ